MKQVAILFILLVVTTPAVADYKLEMVNGDPIVVKWYKLDKEKEIIEYQKDGKVYQLPADRVIHIVRTSPVEQEEDEDQYTAPRRRIRVEVAPGNQNQAVQQAIQDAQRRSDERRANKMINQMKRNKANEERRQKYEKENAERERKSCERRKQNARMNVARYTTRLENAKDNLSEVRRESYTTSTAKSHKKRVRRAKNRVEELERKLAVAREGANESCP